jgi:predicted ATPase
MGHIGTHVHSLDVRILHRAERRDLAEVFRLAGELVDFTSEHGLADHRAKGLIFRGWTVAMGDDPAGGLGTLEEGLAREREIGTLEDFPLYICMYAEALARAGRPDRAIDVLQRERLLFEQYGLLFWMPEVLRILAQVTLQADAARIETAQTLLTDAEEMAKSQGVAMLVLRIAMTAARLGVGAGGPEQGVRRVAEALSRIAEDDGSAELAAARRIVAGVGDRLRLRSGGR